jgi:cell division protein FtsI/penicillin-binding protein 2
MNTQLQRSRTRQMFIFLLVIIAMGALLGRLYYWQIVESHSGYNLAQLANQEHLSNQILNAPRGLIYDAEGHILATNVVRDDVYIEPIQFSVDHPDNTQADLDTFVQELHRVLPEISEQTLYHDFALNQQAVRIAIRIDPNQSQQLQALQLPDIFLEPRTWRTYPGGNLAAQVLGFVSSDTNQGEYGLEYQYNTLLAGKPGSLTAETDLNGNPLIVGASSEQPPVNGANLTLTLNSTIEYDVQTDLDNAVKQMQAQGGAAIVINARTGAIVAMAGNPTFDPNQYGSYANQLGCIGSEEVYFNPDLYCAYEPGSVMKVVTMAAALDQGLITPNTTVYDPGYITFNDTPTIYNWNFEGHGTETMTQVLQYSANVGAAWVAHNILGAKRFYPYLTRFHLGQAYNIDGPEEAGDYRSPTNSPQTWTPSDLADQAFGQSIQVTPLQMAMVYQAIANGGVMMKPYLVSSVDNNGHITTTKPQVEQRVISAKAAKLLSGMLVSAAFDGEPQSSIIPGYLVASKTGTSTTQGISANLTEASMAGFAPATNPQFVILVKLDRPQASIFGITAAGPLWKTIAEQLMMYYHVPPDATG